MDNMEQRVWQRVFAQPEERQEDLMPLIYASQELATAYGHLAKNGGEKIRGLLKGETEILNMLKGLSRLQGHQVRLKPLPAPTEPAARLLEKCFHRSVRARREFLARSAGGEFGEVFRILAEKTGEQCGKIAEVLGNL